jgi:hypothetical protein
MRAQVVDEADILMAFASTVRRHSLQRQSPQPGAKRLKGVVKAA